MWILPEILNIIFSYTDIEDYNNLRLVNKNWNNVIEYYKYRNKPEFIVWQLRFDNFRKIWNNDMAQIMLRSELLTNFNPKLAKILNGDNIEIIHPKINLEGLKIFSSESQLRNTLEILIKPSELSQSSDPLYSLLTNIIYIYNNGRQIIQRCNIGV